MSVLTETRRAAKNYRCSTCPYWIIPDDQYVRSVSRIDGQYVATRRHLVCPIPGPEPAKPEAAASTNWRQWERDNALSQLNAIPTRPVPKHYSEAGEKKGWSPAAYVALAIIIAVIVFGGLLVASSYWRGL